MPDIPLPELPDGDTTDNPQSNPLLALTLPINPFPVPKKCKKMYLLPLPLGCFTLCT